MAKETSIELNKDDYTIKFGGEVVNPISISRNETNNSWCVVLPKELFNNGRFILKSHISFECNHELSPCDAMGNFQITGEPMRGPMFAKCIKCGYRP